MIASRVIYCMSMSNGKIENRSVKLNHNHTCTILINPIHTSKSSKILCQKTLANKKYKFNGIIANSPNRKANLHLHPLKKIWIENI